MLKQTIWKPQVCSLLGDNKILYTFFPLQIQVLIYQDTMSGKEKKSNRGNEVSPSHDPKSCPIVSAPKYFTRLSQQLKPSLSVMEITLCTLGWMFGVLFSIYHVFLASKSEYSRRSVQMLSINSARIFFTSRVLPYPFPGGAGAGLVRHWLPV